MENTICKIIDLQDEINKDIDRLVDLKTQIVTTIKNIENYEYQTLLEKRYLCFYTWEQIAVDMDYSIQHIYRLRDKALLEVSKIDSKVIGNVSGCSYNIVILLK